MLDLHSGISLEIENKSWVWYCAWKSVLGRLIQPDTLEKDAQILAGNRDLE